MKPLLFDILYYLQILRVFKQFYFHYAIKKYIKKDDIVIDIGANWGCYTRLFLRCVGKDGIVEAVDPITTVSEKPNLIVWREALGSKEQIVKLKQWRNSSGAYKISDDGDIEVYMVRGSLLFSSLDKINFIKIDVEGSELPIIEDMKELIKEHKSMILIETGQIDKILEILTGYEIKEQCLNDYFICPKN